MLNEKRNHELFQSGSCWLKLYPALGLCYELFQAGSCWRTVASHSSAMLRDILVWLMSEQSCIPLEGCVTYYFSPDHVGLECIPLQGYVTSYFSPIQVGVELHPATGLCYVKEGQHSISAVSVRNVPRTQQLFLLFSFIKIYRLSASFLLFWIAMVRKPNVCLPLLWFVMVHRPNACLPLFRFVMVRRASICIALFWFVMLRRPSLFLPLLILQSTCYLLNNVC